MLNGDCTAGEGGESGVLGSKSRKLLAYLSAPARAENRRLSGDALEPFLLLVMVTSGMASSGGVLRGPNSSEEDWEIDSINDSSDLVRIPVLSGPPGWAFIGTLVVEIWGSAGEVG